MKSEIVKYYESCGSIQKTAKSFFMSCQKVRKILITEGAYKTDRSAAINDMYATGYSIDDIAFKLKITKTCVNSYLPYTKEVYNSPSPTKNAIKIRQCRQKARNPD